MAPDDIALTRASWNKVSGLMARAGYVTQTGTLADGTASFRLTEKGVKLQATVFEIFREEMARSGELNYTDFVVFANILFKSKPL